MIEVKGKYNTAKIYTDDVEQKAIDQIQEMCDMEYLEECKIRIMPDVHAGKGCTIGTTIKIKDKICPNYVGVDIGCGVLLCRFMIDNLDLEKVDKAIKKYIPSGRNIHTILSSGYYDEYDYVRDFLLDRLRCKDQVDINRAVYSLGTLGGGNHFIEICKSKDENYYYLIIHTGSRHIGLEVANYYQQQAYKQSNSQRIDIEEKIKELKKQGRENEIEQAIKEIKSGQKKYTKENAYLSGELFRDYIHDMKIIQEFARRNRLRIAEDIFKHCIDADVYYQYCETIHNYIDTDEMILRKGSVRAHQNEVFILPLNMRDGSLICIGKGNPEWNSSAPHGAGRLLSRMKAKEQIKLEDYRQEMADIYSSSVCEETIDESPMAYKDKQTIIDNIGETAEILEHIKPIYNFKATD